VFLEKITVLDSNLNYPTCHRYNFSSKYVYSLERDYIYGLMSVLSHRLDKLGILGNCIFDSIFSWPLKPLSILHKYAHVP